MDFEKETWCKIDLIKLARAIDAKVGLKDAETLTEAWLQAKGKMQDNYITLDKAGVLEFARFIGAYASGMFAVENDELAWNKPRFLTSQEIMSLSNGNIMVPRD